MYKQTKIAVVVPAYNEEKLIVKTVTTIPNFVDKIIVVDDKSTDDTINIVESLQRNSSDRLFLIKHERNKGVGGAIKTGYKKALDIDMDITAVMAGDGQMDPEPLPKLLDPIIEGKVEYTKGNRLEHIEKLKMPRIRRFGNSILTLLTKVASGYWNILDPQNGYTAISKRALEKLDFDNIYDGYGCPNDILVELNIKNIRVKDIEMPPVYETEKSGIRIRRYFFRLSWLLLKGFFRRINKKYGGLHFHPLWLFYYSGILMLLFGVTYSLYLAFFVAGSFTPATVLLPALFLIMGYMSIMFALFFDMETNKELVGKL